MSNPLVPIYTANVDANGLFVTAPRHASDGGDSLANNASYLVALATTRLFTKYSPEAIVAIAESPVVFWSVAERYCGVQDGTWVRNPDPTKWYSNPDTTSRDQILPALLAMGLNKEYKNLARSQWRIIKRGFFAQNVYHNGADGVSKGKKLPDTFLGHLHMFIRCWGIYAYLLYPILLVADLTLLASAVVNVLGSQNKDPNNCDDRNGINCHIAALYAAPTPISYLARKIYAKYRPATLASIWSTWCVTSGRDPESNHVMGALVLYFWENNPIIAEAYRPIIERYFS